MAMYLKQSTSVDVPVGPFLDEADGKTAETALTITQPDVRLKKGAAAWAQKAAAQTLSHEENGWYEVTLDATDTDTIGPLMLAIHESGALPVWREFHVLAANVYDSLFGAATDKLDVNVEEWNATAVPSEHTAGYPIATIKDGTGTGEINTNAGAVALVDLVTTTTTATNATTVNGLAANVITATSINADAITAAKIADGAIDRATFAADTGLQTIRSGTAQAGASTTITLDASASAVDDFYKFAWVLTTGGTGAGQMRRISIYVGSSKIANIVPDWVTNPDATTTFAVLGRGSVNVDKLDNNTVDGNVIATGAIGSAQILAGAITTAAFASGAINNAAFNVTETLTANPAAGGITAASFVAGAIDAAAIATGAIDADAIALDGVNKILGSVSGTADSGSTTTVVDAERTEADTDYWKDALITFTSGTLNGQSRLVTAFNAATDTLTFTPATTVAVGTHTYRLIPGGQMVLAGVTHTGAVVPTVTTVTGLTASNLDATISSRATPAQVNTEVLDVLNTDTFAEPGQATPAATSTLVSKIGYLYKFLRNRITQTATTMSVYNDDATTVDQKSTVSDNGTTYDRGEITTGP
jgi:hypothetical protein